MKKALRIVIAALAFTSLCFGSAPVESAKSTIFILLSTAGGADSAHVWTNTGVDRFLQSDLSKDQLFLYHANYDITAMSPAVYVDERLAGEVAEKSILRDAQNKWFEQCQDARVKAYYPDLEKLKKTRPDLVPSRYVLIVEGAVGLAVREYIQSEKYKGEFSNVLFFNTPHEGTGFADQALFSQSQADASQANAIKKSFDASSLGALIPMVLAAYLVDGAAGLQDMMMNLAKDAIMGMAYDAKSINDELVKTGLFENFNVNNQSLWYLAQDADLDDSVYKKIIEPNNLDVAGQIGSTQLLNSFSRKTSFNHPNYNIVYSYGLPTIGNGRRTLDDFINQKKIHVSNAVLSNILADSLKNVLGSQVNVEKIKTLSEAMIKGDISNETKKIAGEIVSQYQNQIPEIGTLLGNEKLSGYLNGLSEIRNFKFNKDDIVGSSMKLLSIIQKFIPDEYKSELYSLFMNDFSPAIKTIEGTLKEGLNVVSSSLSSYSINFFDEGVFDVPSYSALANNVAAFKEAGANRLGVDMDAFVRDNSSQFRDLAKYREMLSDVGDFEETRKVVDAGLKGACLATVLVGGELAVKACEAAEFATNIGMIAEMSSKIKKIVAASGALKKTKEIALSNSVLHKNAANIYTHNYVQSDSYEYKDLEGMLFGAPQISLASVQLDSAGKKLIVPEIFTEICGEGEIYNGIMMNSLCRDSLGGSTYVQSFTEDELDNVDFSSARAKNNANVVIKRYDGDGISYSYYKTFPVADYIKEMRFYVDDLAPKELRWIKFDFNTRVQISYERISDSSWEVFFEKSYLPSSPIDTVKNLIDDRGVLIFRPSQVLDKYNAKFPNDKYGLGGLQEDGVNIINMSAMNRLGRSGSVQMPYFFRATELNLQEGWPKSNDEVSSLKHVYSFMNNVGYPYNLVQTGLKVTSMEDKTHDSIAVSFRLLDVNDSNNAKTWIVEADLDDALSNVKIHNGEYFLDWEMMVKDTLNGGTSSFHLLTDVYIDTVPPKFALNVLKSSLMGNVMDGRWAEIVHTDSIGKWAVRAMRAYVLDANGRMVPILSKVNTAEYSYSLNWSQLDKLPPEGPSTLVLQAYDFANPDFAMKDKLGNVYADSGAWQHVLDSNGKFVSGINWSEITKKIWIDQSAPEIVEGSLRWNVASSNPMEKRPDGSNLKKRSGIILNANDTLKFTMGLKENLLKRDTTFAKVRTIFRDSQQKMERVYADVVEYLKDEDVSNFSFVEPAANRLADGLYDVIVEAEDEAGNVLSKKIFESVIVDRRSPSIYNMGSDNTTLKTVEELKNIHASVSQIMDAPMNVGEIECFKRLDAAGYNTKWSRVNALEGETVATNKKYVFSVKDIAPTGKQGTWSVYLKCYDAAGNSALNTDFFDMGVRSPKIIYPDDSINSLYYGKILVKGIAPNPIVEDGDDNKAQFKLYWRMVGDSSWEETGFDSLASGVSPGSRSLAIWDVSSLEGDYELRLSVRGCADENSCPWVSTERIVSIYDTVVDEVPAVAPQIVVNPPSKLVPGHDGEISLHLEHVSDTSKWVVEAKMLAQSPKDPTVMAEAGKWTFDPAMVSPFAGKPQNFKEGLNVWQENRVWHVVWIGSAQGVVDSAQRTVSPVVRMKYVDANVAFDGSSTPMDAEEQLNNVGALELQGISIPAYNKVSQWNIHDDSISISFETDSAFILDISSIEKEKRSVFCGSSGRPIGDVMPESGRTGVVYVHPEQYLMKFVWNGLIGSVYPGGANAVLNVVAYNKSDMSQIIIKDQPWLLSLEDTKIVLANNLPQVMIVGPNAGEEISSYAREKIGLSFGLKGQSAYVYADVLNPKGEVVKTLMRGEKLLLAGLANDAYKLSWGGMSDNSFASTEFGEYTVRIEARSADGRGLDTVEYKFEVRGASNMVDVATLGDSVMKGDLPPVLEIDEAVLDENNELRFVGSIDYLMKLSASGRRLPEKDQSFNYKWEWDPNEELPRQAPALWKKNRFSMGIHRHRDEFPVTVVTMLITKGGNLHCIIAPQGRCGCMMDNLAYVYQINVYNEVFKKNIMVPQYIKMKPNRDVVGEFVGASYPIGLAVKVFPHGRYSEIVSALKNSDEVVGNVDINIPWTDIWNKDIYSQDLPIGQFLHDFNAQPYWEAFLDDFYADNKIKYSLTNKTLVTSACTADTTKDALPENFVCGPGMAKDEINKDSLLAYNPHSKMLNVHISPMGAKGYYYDNYYKPCLTEKTYPKDVSLAILFNVDSLYWNPKWGYNNLANRYVRFDPTNKTLYDKEGYFAAISDKNFYSSSGWKHAYERDSALVTAFEAQRFKMEPTGMNPLLFNDELNVGKDTSSKYYPSSFKWSYFGTPGDEKWLAVAEVKRTDGSSLKFSYDTEKSVSGQQIGSTRILPLDISFTIAPKMKAKDAFTQDRNKYNVAYPYKEKAEQLAMPNFDGSSNYKLYKGLASRVHYGVNDWNDAVWNKYFTINGFVRNPLTDSTAIGGNRNIDEPLNNGKDALSNKYLYSLKGVEWDTSGYWSVSLDSLQPLTLDELEYGNSLSIPNIKKSLKVFHQDGSTNNDWKMDESGRNLINNGEMVYSHPKYVLSKDSVEMDPSDKSHSILLNSVVKQNEKDSVLGNLDKWVQNVFVAVDSLCYRDSINKKYPYYEAKYDSAYKRFRVQRSGRAPNERIPEIATVRGRVPGQSSKWNLQYTKNGVLYPMASGVQDTVLAEKPYHVFTYFNMNKLQGNTTLFLSYGGERGFDFYKTLNLHVGTLVSPDSLVTVTSMYGNVDVEFNPGAWGDRPVDVTVRSVNASEYVYTVFKNLTIAGPVVEILPSHTFPDSSDLKPTVTVTLTWADVHDNHFDVNNLKIYKPDFEEEEIRPLETTIVGFWDENDSLISPENVSDSKWSYVKLKAKTSSFSSFLVTDSISVASMHLHDSVVVDSASFVCRDLDVADTLWAGTVNGWLEYPYPCSGRSNYLLQLRTEDLVAAEHRNVSDNPILWNARNDDFYASADVYESRVNFYGLDGSVNQKRGPYVKVDSVLPQIDSIELDVNENGDNRELSVGMDVSDAESGISKVVLELYFGGRLLASDTLVGEIAPIHRFIIGKKALQGCIGCQASVKIVAEDRGHNKVEKKIVSEKIYPYPSSLVLWYPLQEGFGAVAHEVMGTGVDLNLSGLDIPWGGNRGLVIRDSLSKAEGMSKLPQEDSVSAFSVEMKLNSGNKNGVILTWNGLNKWSIGTDENGRFYIEYQNKRNIFKLSKSNNSFIHLVWTFDGRKVSLFKNGIFEESVYLESSLGWIGAGTPVLGKNGGKSSAYFAMMDLRVYKSALSADQVTSLNNDGIDLDEGWIYVVRATDVGDHTGLIVDQSCALAGKSYVRQGSSTSEGMLNWNIETEMDNYSLYLLARGYVDEAARVEILLNGVSRGVFKINSTGFWESVRVGSVTFDLVNGKNTLSVKPLGNVGIAGVALISSSMEIPANKVDYGESDWKTPAPRAVVNMHYQPTDGKTVNPVFQVQNMSPVSLSGVRLRYYYSGEEDAVQAQSYYPRKMMSVSPDAGSVYYAELTIPDAIAGYDWAYYGNGPQLGLNREPNHMFWNIYDDPSYVVGSESGFVKAVGVALLDSAGTLLNEWACYDADGAAVKPKKEARILVADERYGDKENSTISMVVENTGSSAINGFESRYYYRDAGGNQNVDVYSNAFAKYEVVNAGGNLYYVSFMYPNVILNPGEKSDFGDGVKFAMYNSANAKDYNAYDDPSYTGITTMREFVIADSAIVLDRYGNLLWGNPPRPEFSNDYVFEDNHKNLVYRDGENVYVTIEDEGRYVLEVVNAVGTPQGVLFSGTWSEGEYSISLAGRKLNSGCYLVLRRGNTILTWQILN